MLKSRLLAETLVQQVEWHARLGSTNDRAKQLAAETGPGPAALIVADEQTAGRGRGTNRWWTGTGSLAASLLFDPACMGISRAKSPQVALAAAVAIVDTVMPQLPASPVGLHWPNDVFAAGRKLAGILVEALGDGRHVLGIGLNLNNSLTDAPADIQRIATSLLDLTGRTADRTDFLVTLLAHLRQNLDQLAADDETLGRRYDQLCLQRGHTLCIQAGNTTTTGRCTGIAPDGALILETPSGPQKFYGGVVKKSEG